MYRVDFSQFIASFGVLSSCEVNAVLAAFDVKIYEKNTLLLSIGDISTQLIFVEYGLVQEFSTLAQEAQEDTMITRWFISEGHFHYVVHSFLDHLPSASGIEVLEKAKIWSIKKQDLEALYDSYPSLHILSKLMMERVLKKYESYIAVLRKSAEERLEWFYRNQPQLANRIPQKYVASYLNITPTHLSRIRRKLTSH